MARFSKKTLDRLRAAGWSNNRREDVSQIECSLLSENYPVSEVVLVFLREFQGLSFSHNSGELFNFRLLNMSYEQCSDYRVRIGKEVWPVGVVRDGYLHLLVSDDSFMYLASDDDIYLIGESIDEGVEFICTMGLRDWKLDPI